MYDRRDVLAGTAGVLATLTGGCLADGSNVRYPSGDGAGVTDAAAAAGADTPGTAAPRGAAAPEPSNPALADRTRRVADEIRWFAVTYPAAVAAYRRAVAGLASAAGALATRSTVAVDDVEALRDAAADRLAAADDAVGAHFHAPTRLRDRTALHLDVARKFARRGDHDRTREELGRLREFAAGMRTDPYVARALSRGPIRNRAVDRLRGGERDPARPMLFQLAWVGDDGRDRDGDDEASGPDTAPFDRAPGFRAYAFDRATEDPGSTRTSWSGRWESVGCSPPLTDADRGGVVDAYRPTFVRSGRASTLLVGAHRLDRTDRRRDFPDRRPRTRPGNAVLVQRYRDAATAARARSRLLDRVSREGTYPLGDATWDRVYYDRGGDVTYALACRAGEHLLVTGADRTAWEERVDWGGLHERTWLGVPDRARRGPPGGRGGRRGLRARRRRPRARRLRRRRLGARAVPRRRRRRRREVRPDVSRARRAGDRHRRPRRAGRRRRRRRDGRRDGVRQPAAGGGVAGAAGVAGALLAGVALLVGVVGGAGGAGGGQVFSFGQAVGPAVVASLAAGGVAAGSATLGAGVGE
ncbi:hypothetical protein ACFQRB_13165 [Halobaculum litoreum]|uniref:Uncharacterized protein n=1 Tax=Halobaculum litoreum TaxID=3031998 RepID=A0ABD5XYI8_9EURY